MADGVLNVSSALIAMITSTLCVNDLSRVVEVNPFSHWHCCVLFVLHVIYDPSISFTLNKLQTNVFFVLPISVASM